MRYVAYIMIILSIISQIPVLHSNATYQSNIEIRGTDTENTIFLNITDRTGIIKINTTIHNIELIDIKHNIDNYDYVLTYLGRNTTNFIVVDVSTNQSATQFEVEILLYRNGKMNSKDAFCTNLNIQLYGHVQILNTITPMPMIIENYIPKGFIPDYNDTDFIIDIYGIYITPIGGTINRDIYYMRVYPISFSKEDSKILIWALGVSRTNGTIYAIKIEQNKEMTFINLGTGRIDERFPTIIEEISAIRLVRREIVLGDTEKPNVEVQNLQNNSLIEFEYQIIINASDDIAIKYIIIRIDDDYYLTLFNTPYTFKIDPSNYKEGLHKITIIAVDYTRKTTEINLEIEFRNGILHQIPTAFLKTAIIITGLTIIYVVIDKLEKKQQIVKSNGL